MSFSPSNLARTASASQLSGRRRSFLNRAHRPPLAGRSPVARSTPWLSTCTLTWSLRNPGSEISTTSCSSPASFHSTTGSKSSNSRAAAPRRRSMADRRRRRSTAYGSATKLLDRFRRASARARAATPLLSCLYILNKGGGTGDWEGTNSMACRRLRGN
jgi:hypothetical protein